MTTKTKIDPKCFISCPGCGMDFSPDPETCPPEVFPERMRVIYVAGKYTAESDWETYQNIHHAREASHRLWEQGWAVICPHSNTAFFGGRGSHEEDREKWLKGDFEFIRRSDAIYMLSNWRSSEGAKAELSLAYKLGLEIRWEEDER